MAVGLKEVEHFFFIYKDLEGKRMEITGWKNSVAAIEIIAASMQRYNQTFNS